MKTYQITTIAGALEMIECTLIRETKHHVWIEGDVSKYRKRSACWKFINDRREAFDEFETLLKLDAYTFDLKLRKIEDEARKWGIEL
mgnify:FL=1|jgi:hypothetical protein